MQSMTRLLALLALLASSFTLVLAQTTERQPPAELRILLGAQQVKFATLPEVRELRLAVVKESGETVFDSGPLPVIEFNWDLRDGNSVALPPGLYAYTLSLRVGEAEAPRQHTGHLIIEKGQDQIWLTSRGVDNTGVEVRGGEVVIARSPGLTTTGTAYVASGRSLSERSGMQRDITGRGLAEGAEPAEPAQKNSAGGLGGPVKTNIPDDLVVNGNLIFTPNGARDINMQNNTGGLRFYGAPTLTTSPAAAAIQFWGNASGFPGQLYLDAGAHNSGALILRTAPTGGTVAERMRVTATGNVGIGTNAPSRLLHIQGPGDNGLGGDLLVTGTGPGGAEITIEATGLGGRKYGWISTANNSITGSGNMVLYDRTTGVARIVVTPNGRVGIGTNTADSKLQVDGNDSDGVHGTTSFPNGNGVHGEANDGTAAFGVFGTSNSGYGVVGTTAATTGAGVRAVGSDNASTALEIQTGGIKVVGAGLGTNTPVFIHKATSGSITAAGCANCTLIDHPLTNGDPNAILIITPNWNPGGSGGTSNVHITGVFYVSGTNKWAIFNQDSVAMPLNAAFNVLVVKP